MCARIRGRIRNGAAAVVDTRCARRSARVLAVRLKIVFEKKKKNVFGKKRFSHGLHESFPPARALFPPAARVLHAALHAACGLLRRIHAHTPVRSRRTTAVNANALLHTHTRARVLRLYIEQRLCCF